MASVAVFRLGVITSAMMDVVVMVMVEMMVEMMEVMLR